MLSSPQTIKKIDLVDMTDKNIRFCVRFLSKVVLEA